MLDPLITQGYHALTIAIMTHCMPELAFLKLENPGRKYKSDECLDVDLAIWTQMRKDGVSFPKIADLFCTTPGCVYNRLKRKEAIS